MNKFVLNEQSNIIIYGAATTGSILIDRLKKVNLTIRGFIDKRAYEIDSLKGYPVWGIESNELKEQIDDNTIIIIAVKNVFQHQMILKQLIQHTSCNKYIYMPTGELDDDLTILKNTFNDLLYETISLPYKLSKVRQISLNEFSREDNRRELGNKVVILVPVGFIFTNYAEEANNIWRDIPILAYFPHIRLFQFYSNEAQGETEAYLNFCVTASENMQIVQSEAWKKNIIENRKNVYDQMMEEYELFTDFFFENAPTARWNKKGYFNLTSGKHRATFLAAKGRHYIPVRISLEDEAQWINYSVAENAFSNFQKLDVTSFSHAIENPYFYRYKNLYGEFWHKVLCDVVCKMAEYLFDRYHTVSFNNLTVLNLFDDNRYLARYLYKMGACITDLNYGNEIENTIDKLFHCEYIPEQNKRERYDLVILKYLNKELVKELNVRFVVCLQYDKCYGETARKIATTVDDTGNVSMYCIEINQ